jgi:hypothetical protein
MILKSAKLLNRPAEEVTVLWYLWLISSGVALNLFEWGGGEVASEISQVIKPNFAKS